MTMDEDHSGIAAPAEARGVGRERGDSASLVASVGKAFRILELFDRSRRKLTLTQIARLTGMELSSAQRFVNTLLNLGYLRKEPASRLYSLTSRVLELGHHYLDSDELIERATPHMQRLSQETEEAVNLSVLDGQDIVIVGRLISRNVLRPEVSVGARLPAFLTASGYVLLGSLDEDAIRARLAASRAAGMVSADTVVARCRAARERGYAVVSDGSFPNDITVAAPVFDAEGTVHAALSVSVSKLRWEAERAEAQLAPQLLDAARPISLVRPFATSMPRAGSR